MLNNWTRKEFQDVVLDALIINDKDFVALDTETCDAGGIRAMERWAHELGFEAHGNGDRLLVYKRTNRSPARYYRVVCTPYFGLRNVTFIKHESGFPHLLCARFANLHAAYVNKLVRVWGLHTDEAIRQVEDMVECLVEEVTEEKYKSAIARKEDKSHEE